MIGQTFCPSVPVEPFGNRTTLPGVVVLSLMTHPKPMCSLRNFLPKRWPCSSAHIPSKNFKDGSSRCCTRNPAIQLSLTIFPRVEKEQHSARGGPSQHYLSIQSDEVESGRDTRGLIKDRCRGNLARRLDCSDFSSEQSLIHLTD